MFGLDIRLQGGHKPGKLREFENCQNFKERSGKFEFFLEKPGKLWEHVKYVT